MAREMIDTDQRATGGEAKSFCEHHAGQHSADEPRARRDGDSVDVGKADAGFLQGGFNSQIEFFGVGACRNLRNNATECGMEPVLRHDHVRTDPFADVVAGHHGGTGVIATRFDAKKSDGCVQTNLAGSCAGPARQVAPRQMADKPGPPHILMTRPRLASERFLAQLEATRAPLGRVVISPAISIETFGASMDASRFGGVVATSSNAFVDVHGQGDVVAWCVGDATADAARRSGFKAISAGGDAQDLLTLITAARPRSPLLYLRGTHVSRDLGQWLVEHGFDVEQRVVYDQPESEPTAEAIGLLRSGEPVLVPLFSPRSAKIVASWVLGIEGPVTAVAMSDTIATAWGGQVVVSPRPTATAMVRAVADALSAGAGNG